MWRFRVVIVSLFVTVRFWVTALQVLRALLVTSKE